MIIILALIAAAIVRLTSPETASLSTVASGAHPPIFRNRGTNDPHPYGYRYR